MAYLPQLAAKSRYTVSTTVFKGLNHNPVIADGEMYNTKNVNADQYPLLATRKVRGMVKPITEPRGIFAKEKLAYIDGETLYYDGQPVEGLSLWYIRGREIQMVSMGAYLCIWPHKIWVNTADMSWGKMNARWASLGAPITAKMCRKDGSAYEDDEILVSDEAPEDPENGALWMDASGETHVLKQYNEPMNEWVQVTSAYIRLEAEGIDEGFEIWDSVTISGIEGPEHKDEPGPDDPKHGFRDKEQIEALNADMILYGVGDGYIIVAGILDRVVTINSSVEIERVVPDMDFITESENRLWGCKWIANAEGETRNEIYACKLGDFRNWRCYMGLSTDSYAVSVGTDGPFTGAATLKNYPCFFKDNVIHMIAGSYPAQYTLKTIKANGVQEGCWRSIQVIGDVMYYKARTGVMAWDGSLPVDISEALGEERALMNSAVGGKNGNKYLMSARFKGAEWWLYEYDTMKGIWHRIDETRALGFAELKDECWMIDGRNWLVAMNGTAGDYEGDVEWETVFGVTGYQQEDHKYLSRYNIRMQIDRGDEVQMWLQYDSDGTWHKCGEILGRDCLKTYLIPVIPRRCDHCQLRLTGKGAVKIFGINRTMDIGGDG